MSDTPITKNTEITSMTIDAVDKAIIINSEIAIRFNFQYHFNLVLFVFEQMKDSKNRQATGEEMFNKCLNAEKDESRKLKRIRQFESFRNIWFDFFSSKHINGNYFVVSRLDGTPVGDPKDENFTGISGDCRREFLQKIFLHNKKRMLETSRYWLPSPSEDISAKIIIPQNSEKQSSKTLINKIAICGSLRSDDCNSTLISELIEQIADLLAEKQISLCCGLSGVGAIIYDKLVNNYNLTKYACDVVCGDRRNIIEPADVIIVIGGSVNTKNEVSIAMSMKKFILPVRCTGGAAKYAYDKIKNANYEVTINRLGNEPFQKLGVSDNSYEIQKIIKQALY